MRSDRIAFLIVVWVGLTSGAVLFAMLEGRPDVIDAGPDRLAYAQQDADGGTGEGSGRSSGPFTDDATDDPGGPDGPGDGGESVPSVTLRAETTTTTAAPTTLAPTTTRPPTTTSSAPSEEQTNPTDPTTTSSTVGDATVGDGDETDRTTTVNPLMVYANDFSAASLDEGNWHRYNSPGHAGWGLRRPSAIDVVPVEGATGGHALQITASMGTEGDEAGLLVSGGMQLQNRSQIYGRYQVRVRVDADPAQVTSGVVLLWPTSERWPDDGEIDFVEGWSNRSTRTPVESNLHWADADGNDAFVSAAHPVSATDWHVYTLEWRPDSVSVSVDNGPARLLTDDPARIPHAPMDLAIQLDGFDAPDRPGQQPSLTTPVRMQVDWIRIESLPE